MEPLKEKIRRFKQWQQDPVIFINSKEEHRCNCCGTTFSGNYCPCCSQKADCGSIGWHSVRQSVMDIWGLGTRSFLFSAWQLLLRPGYFINDYISGKRQLSFPPVKMLFILAVAYALIIHWLFPDLKGLGVAMVDASFQIFKPFYDWYETHFSWVLLILSVIAIVPTWIMFRYSPRHTRHTLPEGFFVQVLYAALQVTVCLILVPCWFFLEQSAILIITSIIVMIYYIIGYMQLFGYGLWSTLWRQAFIFISIICFGSVLMVLCFDMNVPPDTVVPVSPGYSMPIKYYLVTFYGIASVLVLATGYIVNLIATRKVRRQLKR